MKKSELTQLTQIIEHIVAKEVAKELRKQLPGVISEVFKNMMGKPVISEQQRPVAKAPIQETVEDPEDEMKTSLRELFAGATPTEVAPAAQPKQVKQYTKNPMFNQILNETVSDLRQRDRMSGGVAMAAAGYAPSTGMPPMEMAEMGAMELPVTPAPVLREGQESPHAPMSALPQGISVLDVAKAGMAPKPVTEALTNFNRMKAVLEASKKRRF